MNLFPSRFQVSGLRFQSVPGWNTMTPPDLAANTPVLNVLEPLRVNSFPMLREKSDQMFTHNLERFLRLWVAQKPLLAHPRFDRHLAAFTEAYIVFVRLGL